MSLYYSVTHCEVRECPMEVLRGHNEAACRHAYEREYGSISLTQRRSAFRVEPMESWKTDQGSKQHWTFLYCPMQKDHLHLNSIVIAVHGVCRGNGQPGAQAGAGIFFSSENHRWNQVISLGKAYATSQRAVLYSAIRALRLALVMRESSLTWNSSAIDSAPGPLQQLERVVIKTNATYLHDGMTEFIYKWLENGFRDYKGLPVINADLFQRLDNLIRELNSMNVEVNFWLVDKEHNEMAAYLANAAVNRVSTQDALFLKA